MSNPYFQFKQFTIRHDKCAMKVGTDGVLLGAWTAVEKAKRILDIGTGTGLVALMIAQRSSSDSHIIALEIDANASEQARENIAQSPWKDKVEVVNEDITHYTSSVKFDIIVSNPPFFVNSLTSPNQQRSMARHNDSLTYEVLVGKAASLLSKEGGEFTVIIPMSESERLKEIAQNNELYPIRQLIVTTQPGGIPKRTLITFSFDKKECKVEQLLTELSRHQYSQEYINLTKAYYLNM